MVVFLAIMFASKQLERLEILDKGHVDMTSTELCRRRCRSDDGPPQTRSLNTQSNFPTRWNSDGLVTRPGFDSIIKNCRKLQRSDFEDR